MAGPDHDQAAKIALAASTDPLSPGGRWIRAKAPSGRSLFRVSHPGILDGILSGDAVSSVPAGVTASIRIAGGRVDVDAGCNTGGGTVAVTAEMLTFGPISLTKMACEPGAMAVERAVIGALARAVVYTIETDVLTLTLAVSA